MDPNLLFKLTKNTTCVVLSGKRYICTTLPNYLISYSEKTNLMLVTDRKTSRVVQFDNLSGETQQEILDALCGNM